MPALTPAQSEAIEILVGLCISSKDPLSISQLLKEYSGLECKPFDTTGFNSVSEMLRVSGRFMLLNRDGMTLVVPKLQYESIHIMAMVGKQKGNGKKARGSLRAQPQKVRKKDKKVLDEIRGTKVRFHV